MGVPYKATQEQACPVLMRGLGLGLDMLCIMLSLLGARPSGQTARVSMGTGACGGHPVILLLSENSRPCWQCQPCPEVGGQILLLGVLSLQVLPSLPRSSLPTQTSWLRLKRGGSQGFRAVPSLGP